MVNRGQPKTSILLVGGAGYIGSQTARHLMDRGYSCVVLDNLVTGCRAAVESPYFEAADLANRRAVDAIFRRHSIGAVLHFAGSIFVGESTENPAKYYRNNVANGLNLLDSMRKAGVRTLIFSSSCAVYGLPQCSPINEDHPCQPISVYGRTKLTVEQMIEDYAVAYGLNYALLRYFNAGGADPHGRLGQKNGPPIHAIPRLLQVAAGGLPQFEIFGVDYGTADGTCIRDYVHVEDLARAHRLALEKLLADGESFRANLGTRQGTSVRQLVTLCETITGRPIPLKISPRRPGDPAVLLANPSRAEEILGWRAELSSMENIIRTAWNWERHRLY